MFAVGDKLAPLTEISFTSSNSFCSTLVSPIMLTGIVAVVDPAAVVTVDLQVKQPHGLTCRRVSPRLATASLEAGFGN
jgi:hypothetical protein